MIWAEAHLDPNQVSDSLSSPSQEEPDILGTQLCWWGSEETVTQAQKDHHVTSVLLLDPTRALEVKLRSYDSPCTTYVQIENKGL